MKTLFHLFRKYNVAYFTILITGLVYFISGCDKPEEPKPANVILLLIDDMGYGDIAAHGNPVLKTPHFDQLYAESARFTNFAVSPTCAPTRAALLTGRHEFQVGVTHTISPMNLMDTDVSTIADLFQKNGYKTGIFGKWHLGQTGPYGPWHRGFDQTLTVPGDAQNSHFDPVLLHNRKEKDFYGYREDILFREAKKFMAAYKDSGFFCYIPTYSPHSPQKAPKEYCQPYEGYINPERPDGEYNACFFGQVANIDENLGKLFNYLDSTGLSDQTLIIAMNDNGGTRGVDTYNRNMRGVKTTPWRGGTRAYSFWKWGEHFPPGDRNLMSGHIDVFPTLAEMFELELTPELEKQLQGSSLLPVLEHPEAEFYNDRMQITHIGRWSYPENWEDHKYAGCSVRWGTFTLVRHEPCKDPDCKTCLTARKRGIDKTRPLYTSNSDHYVLTIPGEWELFDIATDSHQEQNIAQEHPEVVKRMSEYYDAWWEESSQAIRGKLLKIE
jgi:arylsulfatase A-like enzyme